MNKDGKFRTISHDRIENEGGATPMAKVQANLVVVPTYSNNLAKQTQ